MPSKKERRVSYFEKLISLVEKYPRILIVECDNVGSNHMQRIRSTMRQDAVLLMGKKTMMRKAIRDHIAANPNNQKLESLLPHIKGNVGFVFTNQDLTKVRNQLTSLKVSAPAKAGSFAPNDVIVPAGNTGLEPTQTSFLQALNIASKINKGQVEIMQDVLLLKQGDKVGPSEAALLTKLKIKPFLYGLIPRVVYEDGSVYDQKVLDMTDDDILAVFAKGLQSVAAISLATGCYPTIASVPHSLRRGFRDLVSISLSTSYSFAQADKIKDILSNPGASAPAPASGGKDDAAAKKAEEEKKRKEEEAKQQEEEEEEDGDMGLDLFG